METNYRVFAEQALARAKEKLSRGDPAYVRWAALELRDALEFLAYWRMLQYKDDVSPKEYEDLQAPYVVQLLSHIDPDADISKTLFFRDHVRSEPDSPPEDSFAERIVTHLDLSQCYDALTAFLHVPTVEQIREGKTPKEGERRRECVKCVKLVESILSSKLIRDDAAVFVSCVCVRCKKAMMRRLQPESTEPVETYCIHCGAPYTVTPQASGKAEWEANVTTIECGTEGCKYRVHLWPEQLTPGTNWTCPGCKSRWVICMGWGKLESRKEEK